MSRVGLAIIKIPDGVEVKYIIAKIVKSDRKSEKMNSLYLNEVSNRGDNLFSLY